MTDETPHSRSDEAAVLAAIPTDIRSALSVQMIDVLAVQAARAAECRDAAASALADQAQASPASRENSPTPPEFVAARAEYRAERAHWNEGGPTMAQTLDGRIEVGDVAVPVRIHRPTAEAVLPGIVFLHGGGFSLGDLDTHERIARVIAAGSRAAVIAVDYSLSPRPCSRRLSTNARASSTTLPATARRGESIRPAWPWPGIPPGPCSPSVPRCS